jgi:hypothetical protein
MWLLLTALPQEVRTLLIMKKLKRRRAIGTNGIPLFITIVIYKL